LAGVGARNEHLDASGVKELEYSLRNAAESRGDLSVRFYSQDDMSSAITTGSDVNRNQSAAAPEVATPDYIIEPTYTAVDASGAQFRVDAALIHNRTPVFHVGANSFADKNDDDPTFDLGSKLAVELRKSMHMPVFTLHNVKLRVRCSPIDVVGLPGSDINPIQLERMAASSVAKELMNSAIVEVLTGPEGTCTDKTDNEASDKDELYLVAKISMFPATDSSGQQVLLYFFELTLRSMRGPLFSPPRLPCKELQSWSEAGTRLGRMLKRQLENPGFQEAKLRQE
jgi:hypothetical protein